MYSKVRAKVGQRSYIQGLHRLRNRRCHFQTFVVMYGSKNNVSMNATYSCSSKLSLVQSKSRSNVTSTGKTISANVSKDIMYGFILRGFTSPAFLCYQIITTIRLCKTGL